MGLALAVVVAMVVAVVAVSGCGGTTVRGVALAATSSRQSPALPSISNVGSAPNPTTSTLSPSTSTVSPSPSSDADTVTVTTPPGVPPPDDPQAVVQAYFDAINNRDYQRAWDLGGKNVGQSYSAFAAGFATTDHDTVTIVAVDGNTVTADLMAQQTDGTNRSYHGTYTVKGGTITHFSVRATG
ncbi:hypothetical protein [Actinocrispum wychmicini]|uniref:Uncharacterized protein n=1 Tax=Actinocrispum wychmicini TaxID=1213861 RepID=A0A4R2J903_9PSEU|nr:hypothetical protein [Actinocrispum wychmicini]TCO52329.1 hypothetical protein EV192_11260 [Actinocrispum wychmicini]